MSDKVVKGLEELGQIVKNASKQGVDKETLDAKLGHMQSKINAVKEDIIKQQNSHAK